MMLVLFAAIVLCSWATTNGQADIAACPINGEDFQECRRCPATCFNPGLLCTAQCIPGCGCPSGQLINTLNNTCVDPEQCPVPDDCVAVSCLRPICTTKAQRKCCPACADPCDNHTCPTGTQCKFYKPTGETYCEPSCDLDNGGCPTNQTCSLQKVQCVRAPCPPVVKCTPSCPIEGQVFQRCATCPATCSRPNVICHRACFPGCGCPAGQLIDSVNNKCVDPKQCPLNCAGVSCVRPICPPGAGAAVPPGQCCPVCDNPCANVTCRIGSRCKTDQLTGVTYCEETCADNGGCLPNQTCFLDTLRCLNPPCPRIARCLPNPCADFKCPIGSQCRVNEPAGEAYCEPSCDLDNGGCLANQTCSLQTVQCIRAPCLPPAVKCTPRCPPKCSHEFCSNRTNRYKPCSQPSITIPPCPDQCSTTYCSACYYSDTAVSTPSLCNNICKYPPTRRCLFKWSICLRTYSIFNRIHSGDANDFRCFVYACP